MRGRHEKNHPDRTNMQSPEVHIWPDRRSILSWVSFLVHSGSVGEDGGLGRLHELVAENLIVSREVHT